MLSPADAEWGCGLRAGDRLVAGVLSGDCGRAELEAVPGATRLPGQPLILDSADGRPSHLGLAS